MDPLVQQSCTTVQAVLSMRLEAHEAKWPISIMKHEAVTSLMPPLPRDGLPGRVPEARRSEARHPRRVRRRVRENLVSSCRFASCLSSVGGWCRLAPSPLFSGSLPASRKACPRKLAVAQETPTAGARPWCEKSSGGCRRAFPCGWSGTTLRSRQGASSDSFPLARRALALLFASGPLAVIVSAPPAIRTPGATRRAPEP